MAAGKAPSTGYVCDHKGKKGCWQPSARRCARRTQLGAEELGGRQVSFWPGRERLSKKGRGPRGPAAAPHSPGPVVGLGARPGEATWRAAGSSPTPGGGGVLEQSFPSPGPSASSLHKPFQAFPASSSAPLHHPRPRAAGKPPAAAAQAQNAY